MSSLRVTRDSVAMGDDAHAPHEHTLTLARSPRTGRVARWLTRGGYLASVVGGSTWVLRADGRAVAVVALPDSRWRRGTATYIADPDEPLIGAELHVDYALTADPVALADDLRADPLRPTPRRYRVRFVELGRVTGPRPQTVQLSVVGPHLAMSTDDPRHRCILQLAEVVSTDGTVVPLWADQMETCGATWAMPLLAALAHGQPVSEAQVVAAYREQYGVEPTIELLTAD